jgi:hypothetical protein
VAKVTIGKKTKEMLPALELLGTIEAGQGTIGDFGQLYRPSRIIINSINFL